MSLNVFLKMRSSDVCEIRALPVVLEFLEALQHRKEAEVHRAHVERRDFGLELQRGLQPLLDRHRRRAAGREVDARRSSALDLRQRTARKHFGSCVGLPSTGSRACRCTIAAPASAAPIAASAISCGVTGRYGDIDGVWIAPVTAQVMMTLRRLAMIESPQSESDAFAFVTSQRQQARVAPAHARIALGCASAAVRVDPSRAARWQCPTRRVKAVSLRARDRTAA